MGEFSPCNRFYAMLELTFPATLFHYLSRFYEIALLLTHSTCKSLKTSHVLGAAYPILYLNQMHKLKFSKFVSNRVCKIYFCASSVFLYCVSRGSFIWECMKDFLKPATLFFCWGCLLLCLTTVMCSCLSSIVHYNTPMSFHHPQAHYLCMCCIKPPFLIAEGGDYIVKE
jgi:hypothetical protein